MGDLRLVPHVGGREVAALFWWLWDAELQICQDGIKNLNINKALCTAVHVI